MEGLDSDPLTLTLHAVRLLGFAETTSVARRFEQDLAGVSERLLDVEAFGWVSRSAFAGSQGWALTDRGRQELDRRLAEELDRREARPVVVGAHAQFVPLNARFQDAATRWQICPLPGDPMAANDHTDHRWDDRVLETLGSVGRALSPLNAELTTVLPRFRGYDERYAAALGRASSGESRWVDGVSIDSCHVVWMQLHEDLLATLGLERGQET
ncbi:MAG TPA: transcriptional regulator [Actinotalea sp.]